MLLMEDWRYLRLKPLKLLIAVPNITVSIFTRAFLLKENHTVLLILYVTDIPVLTKYSLQCVTEQYAQVRNGSLHKTYSNKWVRIHWGLNYILCVCKIMFSSSPLCLDPCDSQPCQNGGTCVSEGLEKYHCQCPPGYGSDPNCGELLFLYSTTSWIILWFAFSIGLIVQHSCHACLFAYVFTGIYLGRQEFSVIVGVRFQAGSWLTEIYSNPSEAFCLLDRKRQSNFALSEKPWLL